MKTDHHFPLIVYPHELSPRARGQMHGEMFRQGILELSSIRHELLLAKSPHLKTKLDLFAREQINISQKYSPDLTEELLGLAEGAGLSHTQITVLNNYTDFRDIELPEEGCSTIHLQSSLGTFAGQTWDMHGSARNYLCVIHIKEQGHETLVLSLVGCLGLMGYTSSGTMIGVNNINTKNAKNGLIWPLLVRRCLQEKNLSSMRDLLTKAPVTSGHNYLISSPEGGEHWEIAPEKTAKVGALIKNQIGSTFHTNHCLNEDLIKIEDQKSLSSTTHCRYDLLTELTPLAQDLHGLYELLTSHKGHPKSICSHYVAKAIDPSFTCGGGIGDLNSKEVLLWRGCPTFDSNYKEYRFVCDNGRFIMKPNSQNFPYFFTWSKQKDAHYFKVISAENTTIHSQQGEVVDLSSLSFQASFGDTPKAIFQRLEEQMRTLPMASAKASFKLKEEVTRELIDYVGLGQFKSEGKIFYTVSGAESVENALKIARQIKKRKLVLARQVSYHGATMGALSVTGDWRNPLHVSMSEWTVRIPEPSEDPMGVLTRKIITQKGADQFAALIVETVTGANGIYSAPQSWWDAISKICKEFDIFLITDEVICGFERLGVSFGFKKWNVRPDMITMAKGISGGVIPFGAVWTSDTIANYYENEMLSCGLTNYATPMGIAALKGVFDIVKAPTFKTNLDKNLEIFKGHMQELTKIKGVTGVRQEGMLSCVLMDKTIPWTTFINEGIYLLSFEKRFVLAPALTFDNTELEKNLIKLSNVLKKYL